MKLSSRDFKLLRLGARTTLLSKPFQGGTTLFEKKLCLSPTAPSKVIFMCRREFLSLKFLAIPSCSTSRTSDFA